MICLVLIDSRYDLIYIYIEGPAHIKADCIIDKMGLDGNTQNIDQQVEETRYLLNTDVSKYLRDIMGHKNRPLSYHFYQQC